MEAEGLAEEAVELPHVRERGARPAVRRDALLDLVPEGPDQLGVLCEARERVGDRLPQGKCDASGWCMRGV